MGIATEDDTGDSEVCGNCTRIEEDSMEQERETAGNWDRDKVLRQIAQVLGADAAPSGRDDAAPLSENRLAMDAMTDLSGEGVSAQERKQATLLERARVLSKSSDVDTSEGMPLVVFSLANESYGIPTDYVRDVQPLRQVTPV